MCVCVVYMWPSDGCIWWWIDIENILCKTKYHCSDDGSISLVYLKIFINKKKLLQNKIPFSFTNPENYVHSNSTTTTTTTTTTTPT